MNDVELEDLEEGGGGGEADEESDEGPEGALIRVEDENTERDVELCDELDCSLGDVMLELLEDECEELEEDEDDEDELLVVVVVVIGEESLVGAELSLVGDELSLDPDAWRA